MSTTTTMTVYLSCPICGGSVRRSSDGKSYVATTPESREETPKNSSSGLVLAFLADAAEKERAWFFGQIERNESEAIEAYTEFFNERVLTMLQAWAVACSNKDAAFGRGAAHGFTVLLRLFQEFDKAVDEESKREGYG